MPDGLRRNAEATPINVRPGIVRRTLNEGEHTMLVEFHMAKSSSIPAHSHPNEQIGYLVSGRLRCRLGSTWMELAAGDSWCVPGNIEHEAEVLEDTIAIDIFSPPRGEYRDPPPR
jgi:quercetin dioxygenase-like cupin family protein